MPRTVWLPKGVTDEQIAFYVDLLRRVRDTEEWKAWITRGSQSDEFLSGQAFTDYIAADVSLAARSVRRGWLARQLTSGRSLLVGGRSSWRRPSPVAVWRRRRGRQSVARCPLERERTGAGYFPFRVGVLLIAVERCAVLQGGTRLDRRRLRHSRPAPPQRQRVLADGDCRGWHVRSSAATSRPRLYLAWMMRGTDGYGWLRATRGRRGDHGASFCRLRPVVPGAAGQGPGRSRVRDLLSRRRCPTCPRSSRLRDRAHAAITSR